MYVDNVLDEVSLVRNDQNNNFNNYNPTKINSITLNTQALNDIHVITKAYVDQFHQENERSRRDLGIDFNDESKDLVKNIQDFDFNDKKLKNIDSITVNRNPTSDNELGNKKYIHDELDKNTVLRHNQTLQKYLKVSVGKYTYNLAKYDKKQTNDTTIVKTGNTGANLLQKWNVRIETIMVIHIISSDRQKRKTLPMILEQRVNLQSMIALCIQRHCQKVTVILFLSALNDLILFKLVKYHFILTDFQF